VKPRTVQLGEVCEINPTTKFDFTSDDACSFVPMESVDDVDARIDKVALRPFREVAKGYTSFAENDVIVAKITPCMENGKCAVARNLREAVGFGSTEFHVLRASKQVIPEWLFYFWRYPLTRKLAAANMTGSAGQKRVPASFLERVEIPLPELSEQRRIAKRLEQADGLRRTRRYALELSATFLPAAFRQLFGDLRETATRIEQTSFGEVVESNQLGLVRGAAEMRPDFPFDYLRMDGIIGDGRLDLEDLRRVNATPEEVRAYNLQSGDFLFNTRNSRELVGKTALFNQQRGTLLFNNNIMRVRFKDTIAPEFMMGLFQTDWLKQNLERIKSGTTNVFAIYYKDLADLPVVVPPLALQQQFAGLVARVERLRAVQRESLRQAEHLFQSLLQEAFA
jgi:type I restriction enzyme S subunit